MSDKGENLEMPSVAYVSQIVATADFLRAWSIAVTGGERDN